MIEDADETKVSNSSSEGSLEARRPLAPGTQAVKTTLGGTP